MSTVTNILIGGSVVLAAAAAYVMFGKDSHGVSRIDPYGTRFESAAARKRRIARQTRQYKAAWAEIDRQNRVSKKKTRSRRSR